MRPRREAAASGAEVGTLIGDLSVPEDAEQTALRAVAEYGPLDVLVNDVGGRRFNVPTEEMPAGTWRTQLDLNVTSAFACTKIIGGEMVKRRSGRIVNVASISGLIASTAASQGVATRRGRRPSLRSHARRRRRLGAVRRHRERDCSRSLPHRPEPALVR